MSTVRQLLPWMVLAAATAGAAEHPCAAIPAPAERLACFDRAFPPRAAPATEPIAATRDFGFTSEEVRARSAKSTSTEAPRALAAVVRSLRRTSTGKFIATMENGQVWAQTEIDSKARLAAGSKVKLERGAFGSYLLVTPDGIGTKVRRVE
ncbi:MAG: hypothetical protein CMLOHMNK_01524 [Steroidobacteraceae bacterium]|nr:hypothetical protein [Steroidobacteraceae bacterium]